MDQTPLPEHPAERSNSMLFLTLAALVVLLLAAALYLGSRGKGKSAPTALPRNTSALHVPLHKPSPMHPLLASSKRSVSSVLRAPKLSATSVVASAETDRVAPSVTLSGN